MFVGQAKRILGVRQIGRGKPGPAAGLLDLFDDRLAAFGVASMRDDEGALTGQLNRRGPADPGRGAGHQRRLACQIARRRRNRLPCTDF